MSTRRPRPRTPRRRSIDAVSGTSPSRFFFILRLGFLAGLVIASPVVVYQAWAFLAPALEPRERNAIVPTFVLGLVLFSAGVAMAYFIALPMTIRFLLLFGAEWFAAGPDPASDHSDSLLGVLALSTYGIRSSSQSPLARAER